MKTFVIMLVMCVSSMFANEKYSVQDKEEIKVIGIAMKTTNVNGQSTKDIPQFWQKFFQEDIVSKIPNKKGNDLLCIYTNYEGDFMAPYTVIIGCEVTSLDLIPNDMISVTIPASQYAVFKANNTASVPAVWQQIWQTELKRTYIADFEIYKMSSADEVVNIFVGVKPVTSVKYFSAE